MSDQKKWYKSYAAKLLDPDYSNLSCQNAGRLDRLMCYMASAGNNGNLVIRAPAKNFLLSLEFESLDVAQGVLKTLPNVQIKGLENRNADFCVTITNWHKYQRDSSGAERQKRNRHKKREEEKRKEESETASFSASRPEMKGPYGG